MSQVTADTGRSQPPTPEEIVERCGVEVSWSSQRSILEKQLFDGFAKPIETHSDPRLRASMQVWVEAIRQKDVEVLVDLTLEMSRAHEKVERQRWEERFAEKQPEWLAPRVIAYTPGEENPYHVVVFAAVVVDLPERGCVEDIVSVSWMLMDLGWYSFPDRKWIVTIGCGPGCQAVEKLIEDLEN